MTESMTTVFHNGTQVPGVDVAIEESSERWSDYQLKDGTKIRVKFVVAGFVRVKGEYDQEGNPVYAIKGNLVAVPSVPISLLKK